MGNRCLEIAGSLLCYICRFLPGDDEAFRLISPGDEAAAQLSRLSQRKCSVTDCAIQFQILAAACGWNEGVLRACFLEGLDEVIADELAAVDLPRELDNLINLTLRVEGRLNLSPPTPSTHCSMAPPGGLVVWCGESPASWGWAHATGSAPAHATQRQERLALGLCLYCGKAGHFVLQCPLKVKAHQWNGESWWAPLLYKLSSYTHLAALSTLLPGRFSHWSRPSGFRGWWEFPGFCHCSEMEHLDHSPGQAYYGVVIREPSPHHHHSHHTFCKPFPLW